MQTPHPRRQPPPGQQTSPSGRQQTPPDIKWLLNERAALAGRVLALSKHIQRRQRKIEKLQAEIAELEAQKIPFEQERTEKQARRSALDHTMRLVNADVDPGAGGIVNAWQGRYGKRGALSQFVADTLKAAGSEGTTAKAIAFAANVHFDLGLTDPIGFAYQLRSSILPCLRDLKIAGLAMPNRPGSVGSTPKIWRWQGEVLPSLDELRKLADAAAAA